MTTYERRLVEQIISPRLIARTGLSDRYLKGEVHLYRTGCYTVARIAGLELIGVAKCNTSDEFSRWIGYRIATMRLLRAFAAYQRARAEKEKAAPRYEGAAVVSAQDEAVRAILGY